jgi:hypothetical protein
MQIIIIAPQGAGKTAVAEKIRVALGDQFSIVEDAPLMVSPSTLNEIFTSNVSWAPITIDPRKSELPEFVIPFFGHLPDEYIAQQVGWPYISVRRRRMALGLAGVSRGSPSGEVRALREQAKKAFLGAKKMAGFVTPVKE